MRTVCSVFGVVCLLLAPAVSVPFAAFAAQDPSANQPPYSITNPDSLSHNFYLGDIAQGNAITFKVDHSLGSLYRISNVTNSRVGELMSLKEGLTQTEPLETNTMLYPVSTESIARAFVETFTPEEIRVLARYDEYLRVRYALTENGNVLEVAFTILRKHPRLYNIPPQYLEKLEQKLKATVTFVVPPRFNRYKFVTVAQDVYFSTLLGDI